MRFATLGFTLSVALCLGAAGAEAMPIISGAGNGVCSALGGSCATQDISLHPRWQGNDPLGRGAAWVSYADTGRTGTTLAPRLDSGAGFDWVMSVEESFAVTGLGGDLFLSIWADDTARVFLDDEEIFAANFTQDICAGGGIGCEPGDVGEFSRFLDPGDYTLRFEVFQVGTGLVARNNPFGLLYSGEILNGVETAGESVDAVPEPGAALLFAVGSLVIARRR